MNICIETTFYNCSFSLIDIKSNANGDFECTLNFNAGWLSCSRPFTFSRNNVKKFSKNIRKLNQPFGVVAVLENINGNMKVEMECIAPDTVMVTANGYDNSEFEQEARLGFNIKKSELQEFAGKIGALLV